MKKILFLTFILIPLISNTQNDKLPFSEIENYPSEYSQTNIVSRMIEGLGYRYYWATNSLTEQYLNYRPSTDSRSTFEIIEHIYSLTLMVSSSFENTEFDFNVEKHNYTDLRQKTLFNLKYINDQLKQNPDLSQLSIRFEMGGNKMAFPFWNLVNGPISDAIWHSGQVVMNRRASGNPLQAGVNVFLGKTVSKTN